MTAVATGTGTGISILVSRMDGAEASGAQNDTYNCRAALRGIRKAELPLNSNYSEKRMRSIMLCFLKFFMMRYVSSSCMVSITMIRTTVCAAG